MQQNTSPAGIHPVGACTEDVLQCFLYHDKPFKPTVTANTYYSEVGVGGLHRNELHVSGESFIQPDVVPPLHGHQVTKPLQASFVCTRGTS